MNNQTIEFIKEAQLIVSGKHSGYRFGSDRINNYESFVQQYAMQNPREAFVLAAKIKANADALSEETNMTPTRVGITVSLLNSTASKYVNQ